MKFSLFLLAASFLLTPQFAFGAAAPKKPALTNGAKFKSKIKRSTPGLLDPGASNSAAGRNGETVIDPSGVNASSRIGSLIKQISPNSGGGGSDAAGGGSAGSGGGSGGGSGSQSIGFDDSAAKGDPAGAAPKSGGDLSGGGGPQNPAGKVEAYDKWFPACIFLSPNVGNGNAMVKGVVDMAAKCGVNLVVFPFYVKGTPGSPQGINDQARKSCNAIQGLGSQGVNRVASATVTGNPAQAAQMCGAGKDRDTCEDLTFSPGETYLQRYKMTGRGANVNPTGSGIVGRNTPQALATTIFRQMTGLPYGAGAGLGLGNWNEGDASAAGLAKQDGLNDFGCNELRKSSYPNDGRWKWNSAQETYIVKGEADRMFDLGKPIFTPPQGPGGGGQGDKGGGSGGGGGSSGGDSGGGSGGGTSVASGGKAFGSSASGASASGAGVADVATGGAGHKKPPGGFGAPDAGGNGSPGASGAKTISGGFGSGAEGGGASNDVTSIGDRAKGGAAGSDVVSVGGGRGPASVGGSNGGVGTTYDDKANKVDLSISASQLNAAIKSMGGGGGAGGASTTLDASYLNKKTKSEEEAEAGAKLVASKRPRVLLEGDKSNLNTDYLNKMKLGRKTGGGKAYNGPVTSGDVTSLRRQNP